MKINEHGGAAGGAGTTTEQQPGQGGSTAITTTEQFTMPEKFKGKSAEDIAREYTNIEREYGRVNDQYGKLMGTVNQWKEVWNQWDPVLSRFQYKPGLVQQLYDEAERQRASGDRAGARETEAVAREVERSWGDLTDPRDQSEYLDRRFTTMQEALGRHIQESMTEFSRAMSKYVNNYGQLAMKAMSYKIANPKLDINKLLEEAANISSGKYDPMEWAARIMGAPEEMQAQIDAEVKKATAAAEKERNANMFTGIGGGAEKTVYRSPSMAAPPIRSETSGRPTMESARESFLRRLPSIRPPE